MQYTSDSIRRSLEQRMAGMHGEEHVRRTLHDLAIDLIGATDPADLPAECREWAERAIAEAADAATRTATERILAELATRFAAAPDDLESCGLMRAVSRAQAIHVTEVR